MLLLKILLEVYKGNNKNKMMVRNTNDGFILKDCLKRAQWAFTNDLQPTQLMMVKAFIEFITTVYSNKHEEIL